MSPRGKAANRDSLPEGATDEKLNQFLFNAIDKASPYYLSQHDETDSLENVVGMSFAELQIPDQSIALLWLGINAYISNFGGSPVSAKVTGNIDNVYDLVKAVYDTKE